MKVLHILKMSTYSGAENVACQIINMSSQKGIDSVYAAKEGDIRAAVTQKGIEFVGMKTVNISEIRKVIKMTKPDVIHAHDMYVSLLVSLCCGRIPLVSHIHNNDFESRKITLKSVLYLIAACRASKIFWVSPGAFGSYRFRNTIKSKSIVLKNIIDVEEVRRRAQSDPKEYSYDASFIGRLVYPKDPCRLIRVFSMVVHKVPDARIAVVGTGEMEDEVKNLVRELHLCKNVDFLGYMQNPYGVLKGSKVMVMTSISEGTPMSALESLALGVPIVSTPTDGLADLIESGVNGYTSVDDAQLADHIVRIITNPDYRRELSRNAREKSERDNDRQQYTDTITGVYGNITR